MAISKPLVKHEKMGIKVVFAMKSNKCSPKLHFSWNAKQKNIESIFFSSKKKLSSSFSLTSYASGKPGEMSKSNGRRRVAKLQTNKILKSGAKFKFTLGNFLKKLYPSQGPVAKNIARWSHQQVNRCCVVTDVHLGSHLSSI